LTWTALGGAVVYDVASSTLSDLTANGTGGATCLANDVANSGYLDGRADPAVGDGYYYLIRAQSVCGSGTYGRSSAGTPRAPTSACP
jgi:hypothetical protein